MIHSFGVWYIFTWSTILPAPGTLPPALRIPNLPISSKQELNLQNDDFNWCNIWWILYGLDIIS